VSIHPKIYLLLAFILKNSQSKPFVLYQPIKPLSLLDSNVRTKLNPAHSFSPTRLDSNAGRKLNDQRSGIQFRFFPFEVKKFEFFHAFAVQLDQMMQGPILNQVHG
jgi:hypothetical protein